MQTYYTNKMFSFISFYLYNCQYFCCCFIFILFYPLCRGYVCKIAYIFLSSLDLHFRFILITNVLLIVNYVLPLLNPPSLGSRHCVSRHRMRSSCKVHGSPRPSRFYSYHKRSSPDDRGRCLSPS